MGHFLNDSELSVFADQLSMILHSGISVLEGISIMRDDMPKGEGQDILSKIYNTLEESGYLSDALRDSGVFPDYFVEMTAVGERSGMLEDVLSSLSGYYQSQDSFKHSIRDAFVYPLVLLGMLLAVRRIAYLCVCAAHKKRTRISVFCSILPAFWAHFCRPALLFPLFPHFKPCSPQWARYRRKF